MSVYFETNLVNLALLFSCGMRRGDSGGGGGIFLDVVGFFASEKNERACS